MSHGQNLTLQVERATNRLAKLKAQALLRQMQQAALAKTRKRRVDSQLRTAIGSALVDAGFGDLGPEKIVALLRWSTEYRRSRAYVADLS